MQSLVKAHATAWIAVALLISAAAAGPAGAELVNATCYLPAQIALQAPADGRPVRVLAKPGDALWSAAQFDQRDGMLVFRLDPHQTGASHMRFLINPPEGIEPNDTKPPLLLGVKVDGRPVSTALEQDIGRMATPPRTITFGVADRENPLDLTALRVRLNGKTILPEHLDVQPIGPRQVRTEIRFDAVGYGRQQLSLSISDQAPVPNSLTADVRFDVCDPTNYVLASNGVTLAVDGSFPNYESLAAINDGVRFPDGPGRLNDVSWASADGPGPHWIEVDFGQARTISEVVVYWTLYRGTPHVPREVQVQVPADGDWAALDAKRVDGPAETCTTTLRLEPLRTQRFRVCQPVGGASPNSSYMWVVELEAR